MYKLDTSIDTKIVSLPTFVFSMKLMKSVLSLTRGGDSYMKQTGMLVVSLRGVNFGFWSLLGCSAQSANILSRQGLV